MQDAPYPSVYSCLYLQPDKILQTNMHNSQQGDTGPQTVPQMQTPMMAPTQGYLPGGEELLSSTGQAGTTKISAREASDRENPTITRSPQQDGSDALACTKVPGKFLSSLEQDESWIPCEALRTRYELCLVFRKLQTSAFENQAFQSILNRGSKDTQRYQSPFSMFPIEPIANQNGTTSATGSQCLEQWDPHFEWTLIQITNQNQSKGPWLLVAAGGKGKAERHHDKLADHGHLAEQPQVPQLLPISLVLQTLPQLRCPSLDTLQPLNVSLVARGPKLNTVFEVQPHQCRVQGDDHCPSPAGHTISDTSQDSVGRLGHLGTLLAHIQPAVNQHPRINTPAQLGVICKVTGSALVPLVQIIDKDIKQNWAQY
ncbi:hypothetical protein QYF61_013584 [Mycteria americana]|uniref:Uncharacterized protein n=1 Tax=Mycteria americana TaxID=33587 RepID=A0AAN7ML88_MYCAM|nr:hypothetical protein QYF61_013584 [Mycteria americana]